MKQIKAFNIIYMYMSVGASYVNTDNSAVSNIENGITNLTLNRIAEIAKLFAIAPEMLFIDPLSLLPPRQNLN